MARWRAIGGLVVLVLVIASACAWPMDRYGPGRTGHNPFERTIGPTNVSTLVTDFTAPLDPRSVGDAPVVVNDLAFVGQGDRLSAFSSVGAEGCTGDPAVCQPLWTATTNGDVSGSPAIGNDVVYTGSAAGTLAAFHARGSTNCAGSPTVCLPLWTASTDGVVGSPTIANGVVYVTTLSQTLYAFDAAGAIGCGGSPKVCQPRWTASMGTFSATSPPAVADGVVYVTSGMSVYAFDANGVTNCSASTRTCAPLWSGTQECTSVIGCSLTSPAVEGGTVFFGSDHSDEFPARGTLYAYDAQGQVNCGGVPRTCEPEWSAGTRAQYSPPAVANGVVYLTDYVFDDFDFTSESRLVAFDAAGITNCGGVPRWCSPRWTSVDTGGGASVAPSVANGVVFVFGGGPLLAFDAAGVAGCSGTPVVCAPLGSFGSLTGRITAPVITNGRVYVGEHGALHAFGLPT